MDEKKKVIEKWDNPAKVDSFGREPFVETIIKTIESAEEGFNFGISARWGEGKSSILDQLRPRLENLDYKVLVFAPWKYTQDGISIKRKFLIDIYSQLEKDYDEIEFYGNTEKEKELSEDESDSIFVSQLKRFSHYAIWAGGVFLTLLFILKGLGLDINVTQIFLNNLFIPIFTALLPFAQKVTEMRIKQTVPKIETAEQFEKKFNEAIDEMMRAEKPPKRVIIFVDDLDRCSHIEVEQVLTALFTFFNNPHCTYVITADHTVIRRYISEFLKLAPELKDDGSVDYQKTNEAKQKEATEYLKKIFQINFILPKIPMESLEPWVDSLLLSFPAIEFHNPYAKNYLMDLAKNSFDRNPRKIKHFIRTLAFQMEVVQEKINRLKESELKEKENLMIVRRSPELLGKMLIIQDKFPEFYDKLPTSPKLLKDYEKGEIAENPNLELQQLLAQEPKFFESITRVEANKTIDPSYFLYFSGSTGFSEVQTLDPAQIKTFARSGDIENLKKAVAGLTDQPRSQQIEYIKDELNSPTIQPPEKVNVIRSLFYVVSMLEEPQLRTQKIKDLLTLATTHEEQFNGLQSVDLEQILPFIDSSLAAQLLKNERFTKLPLEEQVTNAFLQKQDALNEQSLGAFIEKVSVKLKEPTQNLPATIALIKRFSERTMQRMPSFGKNLSDAFCSKTNNDRQEILDAINQFRSVLQKSDLENIDQQVIDLASNKMINDNIFILSNVPARINKNYFDIEKLAEAILKRVGSSSVEELRQLVNSFMNPAIQSEFGPEIMGRLIARVVKRIDISDMPMISYVLEKLPELIIAVSDKPKLIDILIEAIPKTGHDELITAIWANKDIWINENESKKKIINKFREIIKNTTDETLKTKVLEYVEYISPKKNLSLPSREK